jgi:hypothetical protein
MSFILDDKPKFPGTVEVTPDGRVIHHGVRFRDARQMPNGSTIVDTMDANWLDDAIDEVMNANYVDIYDWPSRQWVRVTYPRDFRHRNEPVQRAILRKLRERGVEVKRRAKR